MRTYSIRLVRNPVYRNWSQVRLVRHLRAPLRMVNSIVHQLPPHHQARPQNHLRTVQLIPRSLLRPLQLLHHIPGVLSGASRDDASVRLAILPDASTKDRQTGCIRATSINIGRLYPLPWTSLAVSPSADSPSIHMLGFKRHSRVPCFECAWVLRRKARLLRARRSLVSYPLYLSFF